VRIQTVIMHALYHVESFQAFLGTPGIAVFLLFLRGFREGPCEDVRRLL